MACCSLVGCTEVDYSSAAVDHMHSAETKAVETSVEVHGKFALKNESHHYFGVDRDNSAAVRKSKMCYFLEDRESIQMIDNNDSLSLKMPPRNGWRIILGGKIHADDGIKEVVEGAYRVCARVSLILRLTGLQNFSGDPVELLKRCNSVRSR